MRSRLFITVLMAVLAGGSRLAAAQDAGGAAGGDAATGDDASSPLAGDDGGAAGDASAGDDGSAGGDAQVFIACDGDLCDTLQGRPTCSVPSSATGLATDGGAWLAGASLAVALCVGRRSRSGTSRPGDGGRP
jgi:hypothetical protein